MKWGCHSAEAHPNITWYNYIEDDVCSFPGCEHERCDQCGLVKILGWPGSVVVARSGAGKSEEEMEAKLEEMEEEFEK